MRCDSPYTKVLTTPYYSIIHDQYEYVLDVPCMRCEPCKKNMIMSWLFRLEQEVKVASSAEFVTLTYAETPITPKGYQTLDHDDIKAYFKRLRRAKEKQPKRQSDLAKATYGLDINKPIKYFICGEYGTQFHRPHYHAIIFNSNKEDIVKYWSKYNNKTQEREPIGIVHIGAHGVKPSAITYCLNYIQKSAKTTEYSEIIKMFVTTYKDRLGFDGKDEYRASSTHLGHNWLKQPEINKWKHEELDTVTLSNGGQLAIPRYYHQYLWSKKQRERRQIRLAEEQDKTQYDIENQVGEKAYFHNANTKKIKRWQKIKRAHLEVRKDL